MGRFLTFALRFCQNVSFLIIHHEAINVAVFISVFCLKKGQNVRNVRMVCSRSGISINAVVHVGKSKLCRFAGSQYLKPRPRTLLNINIVYSSSTSPSSTRFRQPGQCNSYLYGHLSRKLFVSRLDSDSFVFTSLAIKTQCVYLLKSLTNYFPPRWRQMVFMVSAATLER